MLGLWLLSIVNENMGRHKLETCDLNIVNDEDLENLKSQPGLVLLDIYAKWSGPCEIMKPLIMKTRTKVVLH